MKEPKFKKGDWVATDKIVVVKYNIKDQKVVVVKKLFKRVIGQISGLKRKFTGKYSLNMYGEGYDDGYLKVDGTVLLWEIKIGYLNTPLTTKEEYIEKISPDKTLALNLKLPMLASI